MGEETEELSMEWVDIAVTKGGVMIIDTDTGFTQFQDGVFWEDNFQSDPPEQLPNGAYRWQQFKVGFWDEDDAMNVTGGEFVPFTPPAGDPTP